MFNITSKYFSIFNNKPPANWVAHIAKDFLTCFAVHIIVPCSKACWIQQTFINEFSHMLFTFVYGFMSKVSRKKYSKLIDETGISDASLH